MLRSYVCEERGTSRELLYVEEILPLHSRHGELRRCIIRDHAPAGPKITRVESFRQLNEFRLDGLVKMKGFVSDTAFST